MVVSDPLNFRELIFPVDWVAPKGFWEEVMMKLGFEK